MPLRLYMDQDTISFLFDFFTYSDKIGTPTDAPETPLPDLDQLTETILFGNLSLHRFSTYSVLS